MENQRLAEYLMGREEGGESLVMRVTDRLGHGSWLFSEYPYSPGFQGDGSGDHLQERRFTA